MVLFLSILLGSAEATGQEPSSRRDLESIYRESAAVYWWQKHLGMLRNLKDRKNEIVGEIFSHHGWQPYKVSKKYLYTIEAKTEGAKLAIEDLLGRWESSRKIEPHTVPEYRKELRKLTGETFEELEQWEKWFKQNRDYLVWSNRRKQLAINPQAKRTEISTEKSRKRHPWPKRP